MSKVLFALYCKMERVKILIGLYLASVPFNYFGGDPCFPNVFVLVRVQTTLQLTIVMQVSCYIQVYFWKTHYAHKMKYLILKIFKQLHTSTPIIQSNIMSIRHKTNIEGD